MRTSFYLYLATAACLLSACASWQQGTAPVAMTWSDQGRNAQTGYYENTFVIKNTSDAELTGNWAIFFSQLPRDIEEVHSDAVNIEAVNANFFKITPTAAMPALAPQDSLTVHYAVSLRTPNVSQTPEGCYWVADATDAHAKPLPVELTVLPDPAWEERLSRSTRKLYDTYAAINASETVEASAILPAVKQVVKEEGTVRLPGTVALAYPEALAGEAELLQEKLSQLYGVSVDAGASMTVSLSLLTDSAAVWNEEQYRLQVADSLITIEGTTPHGVFNGTQTLLALLKGDNPQRELALQTIVDYPDLAYRGVMIDIARNFTPVEKLKKLVDVLASYKIDRLHLHLTDDEGWRLEIPGIEELTLTGSRRGHTLDESDRLYPGYDGGFDPTTPTVGNGYYTRAEFIDLLQYAARRHVEVIPEIESPGHARAAIVSMKARYNKYAAKDKAKAEEYLLSDGQDTSTYVSAQAYTDNIINVAMPSAYRFMEKVITEVEAMYKEAGVPLTTVHIGGDEVPEGAWTGSPVCREFMAAHGMHRPHELMEYFYCRLSEFLESQGLKMGGWQETVLHNAPATDERLRKTAGGVYCWNTVAEWGGDEIPYTVANNGYPVVLCNVNCFYVDLAYNDHFDERGLSWGGHVDESKSFSALPFSIYRSARTGLRGNKVDLDSIAKGKTPLLEPDNIIGVQAQLFAETIRDYTWVEYCLFPKVLGLVERGWNARPAWETERGDKEEAMYYEDLSRFYSVINGRELPYLKAMDVNFRLPNPGLMMKDGYLYADVPLPDVVIHYTLDGSEPTQHSAVWMMPLKTDAKVIKARASHLGKTSVVSVLLNP